MTSSNRRDREGSRGTHHAALLGAVGAVALAMGVSSATPAARLRFQAAATQPADANNDAEAQKAREVLEKQRALEQQKLQQVQAMQLAAPRRAMARVQRLNQAQLAIGGGNILFRRGGGQGDDAQQAVYVPDSGKATDQLRLAERLTSQQEWSKAVEVYQEIVDTLGDRVVSVDDAAGGTPAAPKNVGGNNAAGVAAPNAGESDTPQRYETVALAVARRVARWPQAGRDAYADRFNALARDAFESAGTAGDSGAVAAGYARLIDRYFPTTYALQAGVRLIDLQLEAGEYTAALSLAGRLLEWHPLAATDAAEAATLNGRAGLLFRAALAARGAGDKIATDKFSAELGSSFGNTRDSIAGQETELKSEVDRLLAIAGPESRPPTVTAWSMPGGNAARNAVSAAAIHASALVGKIELPGRATPKSPGRNDPQEPDFRLQNNAFNGGQDQRAVLRAQDLAWRREGLDNVVLPSVDPAPRSGGPGELFFQDGVRVWGVSLQTGKPLDGWAATYPSSNPQSGVYSIPGLGPARSHQYSVTLTDDSVLAVMGFIDWNTITTSGSTSGQDITRTSTRLVRLNRATGKPLWGVEIPMPRPKRAGADGGEPGVGQGGAGEPGKGDAGPRQPGNAAAADAAKGVNAGRKPANPVDADGPAADRSYFEMSGSPIVIGQSVFVAARGTKGNGFDDAYVLCLDLETGALRWSTYVASAVSGYMPYGGDTGGASATVVHLAASGQSLFFQTNLGALGAINAVTGQPEWITTYKRDMSSEAAVLAGMPRQYSAAGSQLPWSYNPPIVVGRHVLFLPTDSRELLIADAADGRVVQRIPRILHDDKDAQKVVYEADMLLFADASEIVLGGKNKIHKLSWKAPDASGVTDKPTYRWSTTAFKALKGRPFVTADRIIVPAQDSLNFYNRSSGMIASRTPDYPKVWERLDGQGNVVAAGGQVVIAGAERVEIFTDFDDAKRRYAATIERLPEDVDTRLTWAEILFNSGRLDESLTTLDEAAQRARDGGARGRVFATASWMARGLMSQAVTTPGASQTDLRTRALALLDRAARAAESPLQQVTWRQDKAALLEQMDELPDVASVWQDLLSKREWRSVRLGGTDGGGAALSAGEHARRAMAAIITRSPKIYEPFGRQAGDELAAAVSAADMMEVAARYPNSNAAATAYTSASEKLEIAGDRTGAEKLLRRLYLQFPENGRTGKTFEALCRLALADVAGRPAALGRLRAGARLFPKYRLASPLKTAAGRALAGDTFSEAAASLAATLAETPSPALGLPGKAESDAHRAAAKALIDPVRRSSEDRVPNVAALIPYTPDVNEITTGSDDLPPGVLARLSAGTLAYIQNGSKVSWATSSTLLPINATTGWALAGQAASPDDTRNDTRRVVAWSPIGIVGLGRPSESGDAATAAAARWEIAIQNLPDVDVDADSDATDAADAAAAGANKEANRQAAAAGAANNAVVGQVGMAQVFIAPMPIVPGGPNMVGGNAIFMPAARPINPRIVRQRRGQAAASVAGAEMLASVTLAGNRAYVLTTHDRLVSIDIVTGRILWQQRGPEGVRQRLLVSLDFAVLISDRERDSVATVLSAADGSTWSAHVLSPDGEPIVNAALSPDGILVFTTPQQIRGRDLFRPPEDKPTDAKVAFESVQMSSAFAEMSTPGQLLVWNDTIVALADHGALVRTFSLKDGSPLSLTGSAKAGRDVGTVFATGSSGADLNTSIRIVGDHLFAWSPRNLVSYNLKLGAADWTTPPEDRAGPASDSRQIAVGSDFVLTLSQPAFIKGKWTSRISARTRDLNTAGLESGYHLHELILSDVQPGLATTAALQPAAGGIYYMTAGNTLQFLRGAATAPN